jgi:hypothetical protein
VTPDRHSPSFNKRWLLWLAMLAAAASLPFVDRSSTAAPPIDGAVDLLPAAHRSQVAHGNEDPSRLIQPIARDVLIPLRSSRHVYRNLFASQSWSPPVQPVAEVAPSEPSVPATPFTYLGKKLEAGTWEVYLARNDQTLIVREGMTIEDLYRVDRIAPPNLTLTYLPLGTVQNMTIGEGY